MPGRGGRARGSTAGMMDGQAESGRSGAHDSEGSDGRGPGGCGAPSSPGFAREPGAEEAEATNTSDDWCRVSESRYAGAGARSHVRRRLRTRGERGACWGASWYFFCSRLHMATTIFSTDHSQE